MTMKDDSLVVYVDVSENSGFSSKSSSLIWFSITSILGYPYFWKHPCEEGMEISRSAIHVTFVL